jgi:hypothetical protein
LQAAAPVDRQRGHRPQREHGTDPDGERVVVPRRERGGDDLRRIAQLGQHGHPEARGHDLPTRPQDLLRDRIVIVVVLTEQ